MTESKTLFEFRRYRSRRWAFDITTKRVWARLVIDIGPWRVIVR